MDIDLDLNILIVYYVDTMFVDSCTYAANGKKYTRHLLRESYREEGKVKHRTIANISHCSQDEIQARFRQFDFKCSFTTRGYGDAKLAWHQAQPSGPRLPYSF